MMYLLIQIFLILLSLAAIIILPFIFVDIWHKLRRKRNYKEYGKLKDRNEWKALIEKTCQEWILDPPKVLYNPQSRLRLWDAIYHAKAAVNIHLWQRAGLLIGLIEAEKNSNNKLIKNHIFEHIDPQTGNWRKCPGEIDGAFLAYAFMRQNIVDIAAIRPAIDEIYELIYKVKGDLDTVPYRAGHYDIRFVDTIGFVCPFLYCYGAMFNVPEAILLADKQIEEYDQALLQDAFPAHAYNIKLKLPLGIYDWGRGLGWYILGLTECHQIIKENKLPDNLQLEKRMLKIADKVLPFQTPRGGYRAQYFVKVTHEDSSATVLCGLLFEKCYEISRDVKYQQAALRTVDHLMYYTVRGGKLDMCQGDTINIGQYAWLYSYMPFAQGLALKLASKIL